MHIDADVIKPDVRRQFVYNMRYDSDESIKGDVEVIAKGAINLAAKETTNVRRLEFLNATANPIDLEIMGVEGRATILREVAKGLQMPTDEVVPSREKAAHKGRMAEMGAGQAMAAGAGMPGQGGSPQSPESMTTPTRPDGSPKGGMEANMVQNRSAQGVSP
jgi:hypothetical protein